MLDRGKTFPTSSTEKKAFRLCSTETKRFDYFLTKVFTTEKKTLQLCLCKEKHFGGNRFRSFSKKKSILFDSQPGMRKA